MDALADFQGGVVEEQRPQEALQSWETVAQVRLSAGVFVAY